MKANLIVLKLGVKRINRFYIELPYCIIRVSKSIKEHQRASHTPFVQDDTRSNF